MKITHNKVGQNINLTDSSKAEKSADKTKTSDAKSNSITPFLTSSDSAKVDLSNRAQDIQQIKKLASASPDVDQAKVEKFRKLIDEGKYKVDSKAVADRLVDEHLFSAGRTSEE